MKAYGIAVAVLASLVPTTVKAAVINGGFEDGLTGWQAIGEYRVETSAFGTGPVAGSSQAFLSTAFDEVVNLDDNYNEVVGGNAAAVSFISGSTDGFSLEEFFGSSTFLGDNSLDSLTTATPLEGSAIKQTFTASAGELVSFSWNFLTQESTGRAAVNDFTYPDFNDLAFVLIQSGTSNEWISLSDTLANLNSSSTSFDNETGFRTFSYEIPTAGSYTLGIGVVDVGDRGLVSGLLVDSVEAVPEPNSILGTVGMLVLGAGWGLSVKRRQKR